MGVEELHPWKGREEGDYRGASPGLHHAPATAPLETGPANSPHPMSSWLCLPGTGSEWVLTAALGMDPKTKAGSSVSAAKRALQGWHRPLGSEQAPSCMLPKRPFSYPTLSKESW